MKKVLVIFLLALSVTNILAGSVEESVLEASNIMKNLIRSKNGISISIIKDAEEIFNGVVISNDNEKNRALYGNDIDVKKIVSTENLNDSYSVQGFLRNLTTFTE